MSDLIITGIFDGPLTGGLPKTIELFVRNDVADLSAYGVGSASNGGGSAGVEFTLPAVAASAGDYIYISSDEAGFTEYFGFAPDYTTSVMNVNGDDAVELFLNGTLVDTIGTATQDGTGTEWDHMDGWAARKPGAAPSAVFDATQWTFSGVDANDGQTSNATATKPFPLKSYAEAASLQINAVLGSTTGTDPEYVEFTGTPGASLEGYSVIVVESDAGTENGRIDARFDFTAEHVLGENGVFLLGNTLVASTFGVTPNAELSADFIENSSYTIALVETASLTGTTVAGTEVVADAVTVTDGDAGDTGFFDAPVVGPEGTFLPAGFRRDGDTFTQLDFNNDPAINTPTAGTVTVDPADYTAVKIHEIQGSTNLADGTLVGVAGADDESPLLGQDVRIQGVVTQVLTGLGGYYVQEETADADADAFTSEGIFVRGSTEGITAGALVTVSGRVAEFSGETGLSAAAVTVDGTADLPEATVVTFPTATVLQDADGDYVANLEAYEGMLVTIQQDMTVGELYNTDRFGTIRVSSDGRIETFTQNNAPSVEGYQQFLKDTAARSIVLDDGSTAQNPKDILVPGLGEDGKLSAGDEFRMGDVYTSVTGVVSFSEDSASSSEEPEYRINLPVAELEQQNPREDAPEVGGTLKVASFNVLNYFTTLEGTTGANGTLDPRGANSEEEFARQQAKLVAAINAIDADVIGLTEIENDPLGSTSLVALVAALNAAGGTYAYVDAGVIEGAMGGTLEGDAIKNGFLYNTETVSLTGDVAILDETVDADFQTVNTQRPSLAQTFTEIASGESFTAVINHLKSKGSVVDGDVDIGDGQGANADVREAAAKALVDWLATDPTGTGEEDILILGDLNSYAMEDAITAIRAGADDAAGTADDYTNLGAELDPTGTSYVFDGQAGTLDYALANGSLKGQVTGAQYWNVNSDEADAFDYNTDFGRDTSLLTADPYRASDHDPIVVGLDLGEPAVVEPEIFTLEILHMSDQEGNGTSVVYAPNAAKVMNALEAQDLGNDGVADNTIRLSSGDAIIPGAFYDASAAVFGSGGIGDIQIQNELGFEAITLGNHEFDKGTQALAGLISGDAMGNFDKLVGSTLEGKDFTGTDMPYLSTNLNLSGDQYLAPLATAGGQAPQANKIASSTVIEKGGELIGVVGATTPTLTRLSSTGGVTVEPLWAGTTPTAAELDALAADIQTEVDALLAANPTMNKVILQAHMQVIDVELELAARLKGVDVILAGGSNTRLLDENDTPVGDDEVQGTYPTFVENADGGMTAVVNTDGNYKYVGRLVVDFDAEGKVIADSYDPEVSGAYATDDAGVARLDAEDMGDAEVQAIADALEAQIIATQGNVFGVSDVFLNGNRTGTGGANDPDGVRSQETNLGNLTADANLAYAKAIDDTVMVSIKNGGGIRASIGETTVPAGSTDFVRGPNGELLDSEGNLIKPEGGISQADIASALAFNNSLSMVTLTRAELVAILEHGATIGAGQFAQLSGIQYSFDPDLEAGSRILNATITDAEGNDLDVLVKNGEIAGDAEGLIRIVTLSFMADGGDGYPFPEGGGRDRVDLADLNGDGESDGTRDGTATFADNGTEQDAFAEYLAANYATPETAYDEADGGAATDDRIQNVNLREDTVLDTFDFVPGTDAARDILVGTDANEIFISGAGAYDRMTGGAGADMFFFGAEALDGVRERDTITDYEVGVDKIALASGVSVSAVKMLGDIAVAYLNDPENRQDAIYIYGKDLTAENVTFTEYDPLMV
ncbi:ExeM/NucH family extracellular endonuclease [Falsirhodobacter sp. 20TX0035]|uniref:ExeM/NucH family extracellular endonuclease n=1 Tax=Falsirhodobacter sp. 20TX0035 TaxID=3022019 RepID=UPI00232E9FF5|nr:ExeM/NucH family extracellular endonuclease [Falsirhodobacter sp. 20TX0035]MDB6452593.1 ExeM/NucH family extracellular endonuclease [Falsirhodobacter sp. 20TX0035]